MKIHMYAVGAALILSTPSYSNTGASSAREHNYSSYFQTRTITGKVTNASGEPLEGVTVTGRGSGRSVVTDKNGNFSINLESGTNVLVVSFVGQVTQNVTIGSGTAFNIQLQPVDNTMEDVIVVGYGTQKKANLTGSVSTVSGKTLTERPAPNAVNLLQGRVAGLQVVQNTSEPGKDAGSILLRGRNSFGTKNAPLILIDGVVGSLSNLSPDDIENVTVLKDAASSAIYGSRAANGVILVTTKKGKKGETIINYRVNVSRQSATRLPHFVTNSAEYMKLFDQAYDNGRYSSAPIRFPQYRIDAYENATDRNQYPNFDAINYWLKPAFSQTHNLSISGGTEKSFFNISTSFLDQDALLPKYNYKRYNALINYTAQVNKIITIGTSVNLTYKNRLEPPFTGENMMIAVYASSPLTTPYLPDGSGRIAQRAYDSSTIGNRNPSEYYGMGYQQTKEYNLNGQAFIDIKLLKGLVWSSKAAINYIDEYYKMFQHQYNSYYLQDRDPVTKDYKLSNTYGADIPGVVDQYTKTLVPTLYSTLNYATSIGDGHNIKALAGFEQTSSDLRYLRAYRKPGVSPELTDLLGNNATGEILYYNYPRLPGLLTDQVGGFGLRSFFGRVNYDYKGKYFLEGNIRYDGTSKVSPEYRWGTFPSVSAGWLISKEKFLEDKFSWLSSLKLRGSLGVLGNQDIGNYAYQDLLSVTSTYPFGNAGPSTGAVVSSFKDRSIRWESTRIIDGGLDMSIKNGLLGVTFDWFDKYTYNILFAPPIPASIGLSGPTINNGKMRNRGFELELTHENRIGQVSYGLNFQVSAYRNKVLDLYVANTGGTNIQKIGLPYNSFYLYQFDGIVQQGETPLFHSELPSGLKPGDIKMKDVSGPNGKPDGQITPDDRTVVKGVYPDYIYSFGGHANYKGLDFSFFFQGVEGTKQRIAGWGAEPFNQMGSPTIEWENAWTPQNKSNTMPGIYLPGYTGISKYIGNSTYLLKDASYLRLKNVTLSYSFNRSAFSRIRAKDLSIFISADNLLTFTKFKNGDPERTGYSSGDSNSPTANLSQYPQVRILNAGLNIKF